jgi:ATP-dependent helicase HrpB
MDQQREDLFGEEAESDFLILMRAMRYAEQQSFRPERLKALGIHGGAAREAAALAQQFLKVAKDEGLDTTSPVRDAEALLKCVLAGFPDQVAKRLDTGTLRCAMVHGRKGTLARDSAVREAPLIVASEVREVDGRDGVQTLLTLATAVKEPWLREMFPHAFADLQEAVLDPTQKRVISRHITRFHDLELRAERSDKASADDASRLLAARVAAGDLQIEAWDHAVEQWILRLNQLADWWPEFEIPKIGTDDRALLIEQVCHGAFSYSDVRSRAVWPTLKSWLASPQLKLVEDYAPERYELPGGRKAKITYSENAAPFLAARIQDFYGVTGELRIAGGRVPLVLHVLAPNQRPVQITTNLTTFWAESYPKLKVELSRKYPRHEWR